MSLSQPEFEALLGRLREHQTESPEAEGKQNLSLETEGDRAYFLRHIAALANNVQPSYLIIGVENKTWNPIGLAKDSPLREPDATQQRMNQILGNRLDPTLTVRYRTYEADGVVYGLVSIDGSRAPYIVAIQNQRYGGDRTRAEPSHIYRGAIYVRHGANSVVANRQSEVLEIIHKTHKFTGSDAQPDEFLAARNYLEVDSEDFGHHSLTIRLMEARNTGPSFSDVDFVPARSWVTLVFYPVDGDCGIDTVALKPRLRPDQRIGRGPEWFQCIPSRVNDMLVRPRATPRELLGTLGPPDEPDGERIIHFVRIRPSGQIEFGGTYPLFYHRGSLRFFRFVALIGYLWQMTYLSKAVYREAGYHGETAILVNLIGTNGTILADFAKSDGGWLSPFDSRCSDPARQNEISADRNIQLHQSLRLPDAPPEDIETIIRNIAQDLANYYGQDRPRCFDYHTGDFPVQRYMDVNCR